MKKFSVFLVCIVIIISVCASGCSSDTLLSSTTTTTTTTTTTLSEEEILRNHINDLNESIIEMLEGDGYSNIEYGYYVNFQDFINGANNNPSDFFFLGTTSAVIASMDDNVKYYKNSDVLNRLEEWDMMELDYIFCYLATRSDDYGKQIDVNLTIVVEDNALESFLYCTFDGEKDTGTLQHLIFSAITEKCQQHY